MADNNGNERWCGWRVATPEEMEASRRKYLPTAKELIEDDPGLPDRLREALDKNSQLIDKRPFGTYLGAKISTLAVTCALGDAKVDPSHWILMEKPLLDSLIEDQGLTTRRVFVQDDLVEGKGYEVVEKTDMVQSRVIRR